MTKSSPAHLAVPLGRLCGRRRGAGAPVGTGIYLGCFKKSSLQGEGVFASHPQGSAVGKGVPFRKQRGEGHEKVERRAEVRRSDEAPAACSVFQPVMGRGMPLLGLQSRLQTVCTAHPSQSPGAGAGSPGAAPASPEVRL